MLNYNPDIETPREHMDRMERDLMFAMWDGEPVRECAEKMAAAVDARILVEALDRFRPGSTLA